MFLLCSQIKTDLRANLFKLQSASLAQLAGRASQTISGKTLGNSIFTLVSKRSAFVARLTADKSC